MTKTCTYSFSWHIIFSILYLSKLSKDFTSQGSLSSQEVHSRFPTKGIPIQMQWQKVQSNENILIRDNQTWKTFELCSVILHFSKRKGKTTKRPGVWMCTLYRMCEISLLKLKSRRGWWLTDPPCTEEWKLCWDADTGTVPIMACWCRALALAESGMRLPLIICIDGVCDSASGGLTRCMSFGPCQGEPEVVLIISARLKKNKNTKTFIKNKQR